MTSLPTDIHLPFADGHYRFWLPLPQQLELEKSCGFTDREGNQRRRGILSLYADIVAGLVVIDGEIVAMPTEGRASAFECREVVRLALIGGGTGEVAGADIKVTPVKALQLCDAYVDNRPLIERWTLAAAILRAVVEGYDPPKKAEPAKEPAKGRTPRTKASVSTK